LESSNATVSDEERSALRRFGWRDIGKLDRGLRRYRTRLFSHNDRWLPRQPYRGRGWHFALHYLTYRGLRSDFLVAAHSEAIRQLYPAMQWDWSENTQAIDFSAVSSPEIVLFAQDRSQAEKAVRLLEAAYVALVDNLPDPLTPLFRAIPDDQQEFQDFMEAHHFDPNASYGGCCTSGFCLSAWIAARASHNRHLVYALMKYLLSKRTCFVDLLAMHPAERADLRAENDPVTHVVFAHAIVQAYSVIEELGFEVRASQTKPSVIDGGWNPEVRKDLTVRLVKGRIDLANRQTWMIHGPSRVIDRSQPHLTGPKAPWARGAARDIQLAVEDAIARASYLRSRVSSHRLSRRSASLTALDVANVQLLARRLLLEHMGAFKHMSAFSPPEEKAT
jgi:hypothetical protein